MKLEIKHLAPYLPYGLKVCIMGETVIGTEHDDSPKPIIFELVGLDIDNVEYHEIGRTVTEQIVYTDCFPILHPLSDLTKEIEVNGEKFVPYKKMESELLMDGNLTFGKSEYGWVGFYSKEHGINLPIYLDFDNKIMGECDFMFYEMMCKWHFDFNNLIGQGLAIDINTLK